MKKIILLIIILLITYPLTSTAYTFGETNFSGFMGYPPCNCIKPSKPYKPFSFNSQIQINMYNYDVDNYNIEIKNYIKCINTYIEGCNNDIDRIREKATKALNKANSL